jgi:hypothetical protein
MVTRSAPERRPGGTAPGAEPCPPRVVAVEREVPVRPERLAKRVANGVP